MVLKSVKANKNIFWLIFFVWLFFPTHNIFARVYSSSDYVSLYSYPQTFYYYTQTNESVSQVRTGYQNLYNYDDPIIRCRSEGGTCAYDASYLQTIGLETELSRYKVYVPPGTTSTYLATYLSGQASRYVVVARLGQPPTGDYDGYLAGLSEQDYSGLPTGGFNLKELKNGDYIGANNAGILTIATGGILVASEADGGWLYVILLPIRGSVIGNGFSNHVDTDAYMRWFRSKNWGIDGDPSETPTPTFLLGDLDRNRKVDIFDFNLFLAEFGKVVAGNLADLDNNGKVDIFDFNIFLSNFGRTNRRANFGDVSLLVAGENMC